MKHLKNYKLFESTETENEITKELEDIFIDCGYYASSYIKKKGSIVSGTRLNSDIYQVKIMNITSASDPLDISEELIDAIDRSIFMMKELEYNYLIKYTDDDYQTNQCYLQELKNVEFVRQLYIDFF